jgi:hypothetical protein
MGGDIPARDNIFAYNQVYGGRVGMLDTENVLIVGNYVEGSLRALLRWLIADGRRLVG